MAKKRELSITLRAKNAMRKGLRKAKKSLRSLKKTAGKIGRGIGNVFKVASKAAIGLGAAIAAAATKAVAAYAKQEKAEKALRAALRTQGDAADALIPKYKKLASAIQDETAAADENTLQMMAQIRNLGVMPKNMEKATKGAMGLAKALDLNSQSAARYTALAMQGETTVLQRYVPALRSASSEAEKQKIVTDLMSKGYKQLQDELKTTGGRWDELKGRIGDTLEKVGKSIKEGLKLEKVFKKWSAAIKKFQESEALKNIQDRIKNLLQDAIAIVDVLTTGGEEQRSKMWEALSKLLVAAFHRGAEIAVDTLKKAAPKIGKILGGAAHAAWEALKAGMVSTREINRMGEKMGLEKKGEHVFRSMFSAKKLAVYTKEQKKQIKQQIRQNKLQEKFNLLGLETIEGKKEETAAQKELRLATVNLGKQIEKVRDQQKKAAEESKKAAEESEEQNKKATKSMEERRKAVVKMLKARSGFLNMLKKAQKVEEKDREVLEPPPPKKVQEWREFAAIGDMLDNLTESKAKQWKRALNELSTVDPIPDLNLEQFGMGGSDWLRNFTAGKARQMARAFNALQGPMGMKPLPDLNLEQFDAIAKLDAGKIKGAMKALNKAQQQKNGPFKKLANIDKNIEKIRKQNDKLLTFS